MFGTTPRLPLPVPGARADRATAATTALQEAERPMIVHDPFGIDDPYKSSPAERFPRDPAPGDAVQVGFRVPAGAREAWAEVTHTRHGGAPESRRVAAMKLAGDAWAVDLGSFPDGGVECVLRALPDGLPGAASDGVSDGTSDAVSDAASGVATGGRPLSAGPYRFDVGAWTTVTGVGEAFLVGDASGDEVRVELTTDRGTAWLAFAFPTAGACRLVLRRAEPTGAGAAPRGTAGENVAGANVARGKAIEENLAAGNAAGESAAAKGAAALRGARPGSPAELRETLWGFTIEAPGIVVRVERADLTVSAATPGAPHTPLFSGSLRFAWLERAGVMSTTVVANFLTGEGEAIYGLGERFVDADRNGQRWDLRVYEEYKEQRKRTYIPVPLLVSERSYGVWLDVPEPSYLDLTEREAAWTVERLHGEPDGSERSLLDLVVFVADEPYAVTAAFTRLTGRPAVPPAWAFGPWMSANTWNSQALVEEVVGRTLAEDVPASVIVIEAWSDESTFYIFNDAEYEPKAEGAAHRLGDFRFKGRWPDPKAMVDWCHANGVRVVLWQIPVHKRLGEPHAQHDLDGEYMLEHGLAVLNRDGSAYRNKGWWFTDALVADFSNPATSEFWFGKRRYLFDELGIDGMKTDGGEHLWGRGLRAHDGRRGLELFNTYANDYVGAYHTFIQDATDGDGVTFSRSGYTGAQRFPIHWAGDEDSTWNAYRASVKAGLSAGVSGIGMWAWDLGGFSGEIPPADLYMRSAAMAAFCPVMQYHSEPHGASERRDRTPWNIAERHSDPNALRVYRRYAHLRMRLRDYLHGEAEAAAAAGLPLMRYPALAYPGRHDFLAGDEYAYLLGRDLLVAPVVERGVETREVRLPPGAWVDLWSGSELAGDRVFHAPAMLDTIPVFVRADSERLAFLLSAAAGLPGDARAAVAEGAGAGPSEGAGAPPQGSEA
ncbi:MAG: hypothetical protein IT345_06960 [Trueperaceae bacterium]|nr:hypothetical protein [Trueperaceae bacterium]